jgi:hypothetical protein
MKGDLYLKAEDGAVDAQGNPVEWIDVWDAYGVGLEDGALDALMGFRPNKEPIVSKNVTVNGSFYVTGAGLVDERTVNVPFHIVAKNKTDFLYKRNDFYEAIRGGLLTFKIEKPVQATYKLYYESCNQYTQFLNGMAKFMLTMYESNGYHDGDPASIEPKDGDIDDYLRGLLTQYGHLATEQEVRNIIRNYHRG